MLTNNEYNRDDVYRYAKKWAFGRNPDFSDFGEMGGDCTNFASQCVYAGCKVMNHTPTFGWFYKSLNDRTPSWTGVEYFYDFMTGNVEGIGPYGEEVGRREVEIGDIVQFGNAEKFYHSPVIVALRGGDICVAAHTLDVFDRPLSTYAYERIRFIKILGFRR